MNRFDSMLYFAKELLDMQKQYVIIFLTVSPTDLSGNYNR